MRRRDFSGNAQLPAFDQFGYGRVVFDVLVQFRHQRALAIPFMRTDDMHAFCLKCVGSAHHRSDVEIVRPVFHGNLKIMATMSVKIIFDGRNRPVTIPVKHVAAITLIKQRRIESTIIIRRLRIIRTGLAKMRFSPRSYAHFTKDRLSGCFRRNIDGIRLMHAIPPHNSLIDPTRRKVVKRSVKHAI